MTKIVNRPPSDSAVLGQKFLTVSEFAALLRLSKMTVYRLIGRGELEVIRAGRTYRIPEEAAAKFTGGTAAGGMSHA